MGGRGGSSNVTSLQSAIQMQTQPPNIQPTAQMAAQANASIFKAVDTAPTHDLYNGAQYYKDQNLTADQITATIQYLRSDRENGTQYSMSQNMNWLMTQNADQGKALTDGMNANQRFTFKHLMASMHNLGHNVNLTRFDHADAINAMLSKFGVKNADINNMTAQQIKNTLTGQRYGEEKFVSTSYNGFKNAPKPSASNGYFTFTDRQVEIRYSAKAKTRAMMPGNGPGGRLGEIVLAPSQGRQNYHITKVDVSSGNAARRKGTPYGSMNGKKIILYVDVD